MRQIIVSIDSAGQHKEVPLADGTPVTIGRTSAADTFFPDDHGLSRRHATLRLVNGRPFLSDEGSTNGTMLNGGRISSAGTVVGERDEIRIGNDTIIHIIEKDAKAAAPPSVSQTAPQPAQQSVATEPSIAKYLIPAIAVAFLVLIGVGFVLYKYSPSSNRNSREVGIVSTTGTPQPEASEVSDPQPSPTGVPATDPTPQPSTETPVISTNPTSQIPIVEETPPPPTQRKLYKSMSDDEQKEFVKQRAQHVAIMMGKRPYAFTPEALVQIKFWLDAFSRRAGNNRTGLWGGDTVAILQRGKGNAPLIIRAFKQFGVPYVVGLYIPFIETEYNNIASNNAAGAAGLFQFLGPTAESYGVPAAERTNVAKMAPAAARYFRDNILSFGDDSMSVALSIAGYNRAPESVKRDLRNVLNAPSNEDKERSFWTLIANQGKLDEFFQKENVNYVPRFFAAAIFGETPWAFGIDMRPLSTYTEVTTPDVAASPAE